MGHPLNKPRSIFIWKKYFKENDINAVMKPYDIPKKNFKNFMNHIFLQDKKFRALVVTMPFKRDVLKFADTLHKSAQNSNASNLLVKKNNLIFAYNTDIMGAYDSIKKYLKNYNNIVIIGLGGAGQALFSFLYNRYNKKKFILISKKFNFKSPNVVVLKSINEKIFTNKSIIINCTPLGSNLKSEYLNKSPIEEKYFKNMNNKSLIFDIVYKPKRTKLYSFCKKNFIPYLDGLKMNSTQAQIALNITFNKNR